jgi:prepilin-type N-terminal cleavage/methylation domain-containing protein/prepilin-type processing-associated H-X9-DG protein
MNAGRRAFTLVELLIVIAIIALLISLLLPMYRPIAMAVDRARCQTQLKGLMQAYLGYATSYGRFPPLWSAAEYDGASGLFTGLRISPNCYIVTSANPGRRFDVGFGYLVWDRSLQDPKTFVCPVCRSDYDPWWHDKPVSSKVSYWWHADGTFTNRDPIESFDAWWLKDKSSSQDSFASYCLRPGLYPMSPAQAQTKGIRAFMADNMHFHYTDPTKAERDVISQRHESGVNVGYLDGSVDFRSDEKLFKENYASPAQQSFSGSLDALNNTKMGAIWASFDQ